MKEKYKLDSHTRNIVQLRSKGDSGPGPELDTNLEDAVSPDHVDVTSEHIRGAVRGGHRHHGLGLGVLEGRLPL